MNASNENSTRLSWEKRQVKAELEKACLLLQRRMEDLQRDLVALEDGRLSGSKVCARALETFGSVRRNLDGEMLAHMMANCAVLETQDKETT